jgi:hypothetical protein
VSQLDINPSLIDCTSVPYPFLTISPFPIRVVIYAATTLIAYLSLLILNYVHPRQALATGVDAIEKPVSPKAFSN